MTGQFDVHAVAMQAVEQASIEDPRIHGSDKHLIGAIAQAFKHYELRVDAAEATAAVRTHYRQSGDRVTAEAIVHVIRRTRLDQYRTDMASRSAVQDARATEELDEAIAAIRAWVCDDCGAGPGEWCTNKITGLPYGDRVPGHPSRICKATAA